MDDFVSRQKVLRLIRMIIPEETASGTLLYQSVSQMDSEEPEIIYCGECKHMMPNGKCLAFADLSIRPMASDYCSKAERGME